MQPQRMAAPAPIAAPSTAMCKMKGNGSIVLDFQVSQSISTGPMIGSQSRLKSFDVVMTMPPILFSTCFTPVHSNTAWRNASTVVGCLRNGNRLRSSTGSMSWFDMHDSFTFAPPGAPIQLVMLQPRPHRAAASSRDLCTCWDRLRPAPIEYQGHTRELVQKRSQSPACGRHHRMSR